MKVYILLTFLLLFMNCQETSITNNYCGDHKYYLTLFCINVVEPVCGWFDESIYDCETYPCAQEFNNGCWACKNSYVEYYTSGKCPETKNYPYNIIFCSKESKDKNLKCDDSEHPVIGYFDLGVKNSNGEVSKRFHNHCKACKYDNIIGFIDLR